MYISSLRQFRCYFVFRFGDVYFKHNGQDIWNHIVDIYERDLDIGGAHPGLRKLHKLREEHIRLSPRHRMRVKLAVQVSVCVIQVVLI